MHCAYFGCLLANLLAHWKGPAPKQRLVVFSVFVRRLFFVSLPSLVTFRALQNQLFLITGGMSFRAERNPGARDLAHYKTPNLRPWPARSGGVVGNTSHRHRSDEGWNPAVPLPFFSFLFFSFFVLMSRSATLEQIYSRTMYTDSAALCSNHKMIMSNVRGFTAVG